MATKKLKKLPNNIEEIIHDDEALKKVFERCDINAYSGSRNILFYDISDEMVKWCLEQGADPNHHDGKKDKNYTPLLYMLSFMEHGSGKPDIAEILIKACGGKEAIPSEEWEKARVFVRKKGERLEEVRANYPDHSFEQSDAVMDRLYKIFEVEPVKRIIKHDGVSPIIVDSTLPVGKIHDMLWDYLVPGEGSCKTVQGEVIRITGCVADEVYRNGGANWSRGYRKMVNNLPQYLSLGQPLSESELEEVDVISKPLPNQGMTEIERLEELAVKWVSINSIPISLE